MIVFDIINIWYIWYWYDSSLVRYFLVKITFRLKFVIFATVYTRTSMLQTTLIISLKFALMD